MVGGVTVCGKGVIAGAGAGSGAGAGMGSCTGAGGASSGVGGVTEAGAGACACESMGGAGGASTVTDPATPLTSILYVPAALFLTVKLTFSLAPASRVISFSASLTPFTVRTMLYVPLVPPLLATSAEIVTGSSVLIVAGLIVRSDRANSAGGGNSPGLRVGRALQHLPLRAVPVTDPQVAFAGSRGQ